MPYSLRWGVDGKGVEVGRRRGSGDEGSVTAWTAVCWGRPCGHGRRTHITHGCRTNVVHQRSLEGQLHHLRAVVVQTSPTNNTLTALGVKQHQRKVFKQKNAEK